VGDTFNPAGQTDGIVNSILQQTDLKVLVGGAFNQVLGVEMHGLARLLEDGSLDPDFSANTAFNTNTTVQALGLQSNGKVLVSYYVDSDYNSQRIARLNTNGTPDPAWNCTNIFAGSIYALLPLSDRSILAGAYPSADPGLNLFRLQTNGLLDQGFNSGLDISEVIRLLKKPDGHILVGGQLLRSGETNPVPLLQLTANLQWDSTFIPDAFAGPLGPFGSITSLLLQPDGKIVAGGDFLTVGGYARAGIVRLTAAGRVDTCFEPGLGLGTYSPFGGAVRAMDLQSNGRIVIGGSFLAADDAHTPQNIARVLPQSDCSLIRTYLIFPEGLAIATFPPGGTNVLETSNDLQNWREVQRDTNVYIYSYLGDITQSNSPAFFRARQER